MHGQAPSVEYFHTGTWIYLQNWVFSLEIILKLLITTSKNGEVLFTCLFPFKDRNFNLICKTLNFFFFENQTKLKKKVKPAFLFDFSK